MYCTECGKEVSQSVKFCIHCGKKVLNIVGEPSATENIPATQSAPVIKQAKSIEPPDQYAEDDDDDDDEDEDEEITRETLLARLRPYKRHDFKLCLECGYEGRMGVVKAPYKLMYIFGAAIGAYCSYYFLDGMLCGQMDHWSKSVCKNSEFSNEIWLAINVFGLIGNVTAFFMHRPATEWHCPSCDTFLKST